MEPSDTPVVAALEATLDVHRAAALAGRSPETIRRWVRSGRLEARREGRGFVILRRDLHDALAAGGDQGGAMTLAGWAASLARPPGAGGLASAADLVLGDRRRRESDVS